MSLNPNNWANWPTISQLERAVENTIGGYRIACMYKGNGIFFYQALIICGDPWSPDIDVEEDIIEYYTAYKMWEALEDIKKMSLPAPPVAVGMPADDVPYDDELPF